MKSYRRFLEDLTDKLVDAIANAENDGWHHLPAKDERMQHYLRMITWLAILDERKSHYDAVTVQRAWKRLQTSGPPPGSGVVRAPRELDGGRGGPP